MKRYNKIFSIMVMLVLFSLILSGCKKLVNVDLPIDNITSESAFSGDGTAISFVTGTYTTMGSSSNTYNGVLSLSFLAGLSADELKIMDAQTSQILALTYKNKLSSLGESGTSVSTYPEYWTLFYSLLYRANVTIEKVSKSETLTPSIKQYLLGEAKFMRGYLYFYLVNLYGDVPLVTTSDWRTNSDIARAPKDQVYEQIISDLKEAKDLLPTNYMAGDLKNISVDRVRPTKWAALAMLSRVYLYTGKYYKESEDAATEVINNINFGLPALSSAFLRTSNEVIWSIQPTDASRNTQEALRFLLTGAPTTTTTRPFYLNPDLVNGFESNDPRKTVWIQSISSGGNTYYYPTKYKANSTSGASQTEYSVLIRLAEVYLNRAEARARQNKLDLAAQDLNTVRKRARGSAAVTVLPDYPATITQTDAITACIKERRFELFTELGHRWLDLKRTGTIDAVMNDAAGKKGTTWDSNWALYPIPYLDIQRNPLLTGKQNPGY